MPVAEKYKQLQEIINRSVNNINIRATIMEEGFELPVSFNDTELHFPARLLSYGYSYKLEVEIEGKKILFEPDEERNWRALVAYEDLETNKKINVELLKAVASSIEDILQ